LLAGASITSKGFTAPGRTAGAVRDSEAFKVKQWLDAEQ
jgi:hypothetical protein